MSKNKGLDTQTAPKIKHVITQQIVDKSPTFGKQTISMYAFTSQR